MGGIDSCILLLNELLIELNSSCVIFVLEIIMMLKWEGSFLLASKLACLTPSHLLIVSKRLLCYNIARDTTVVWASGGSSLRCLGGGHNLFIL